jgi:hypothetical protein
MKRKRFQLRGRASVCWAVLAFVGLQVGLAAFIEGGVVEPLENSTYSYRAAHLRARIGQAPRRPFTVVMFGSSRVMNGFKGADIEAALAHDLGRPALAYNFGIPGAGHIYSYCCLKRLLNEEAPPDLVLIEVFPSLLSSHSLERQWFVANELRKREFADADPFGAGEKEMSRAWWERWLVPWHTHRFFLMNQAAPDLIPHDLRANWVHDADRSGWVAHTRGPQTATDVARTKRAFADQFADFRLGGPSCKALHDALALCRRERINVAMVWLPEASDMRSWYSPQMRAQIDAFLGELSRDYAAPLIRAGDWLADEHFSDAIHMRVSGAAIFTERLGQEELPRLARAAMAAGQNKLPAAEVRR